MVSNVPRRCTQAEAALQKRASPIDAIADRQARHAIAPHIEPLEGWQHQTSAIIARLGAAQVTHSERMEVLIKARDLLNTVERARTEFVAMAGHVSETSRYADALAAFDRLIERISALG